MSFGNQPINEAYSVICPFKGLYLTSTGGLLGGIDLGGIDPDAMVRADATRLAVMTANIYGSMSPYVSVTQYFVHAENQRISLRRRSHPIAERLSRAREAALNERGMAATRLVHLFEIRDPQGWNGNLLKVVVKNAPLALFDPHARRQLLARFAAGTGLLLREEEMIQRAITLRKILDDIAAKWSLVMGATVMRPSETWRFMKFLATMDDRYLDTGFAINVPDDDCDLFLANGDIEPVQINYVDMLKLHGARPRYIRTAAMVKSPFNPTGVWSVGADAPVRARGNFVLMTHFSALSRFERGLMFRAARNRLERSRLDLKKMLMGNSDEPDPNDEHYLVKKKRAELEKAEAIEDRWGTFFGQVAVSNTDPEQLIKDSERLSTIITNKDIDLAWESPGLPLSYQTLQPGGQGRSVRRATVTTSRAAAFSLISKSSSGSPTVADLGEVGAEEECQYILETEDGQPFHYSPYVGGKAFALGVGPTGSGKTYIKNTLASHFLKYGGFYRALDIDPGTETLASFYGKDGGIIRLDSEDSGKRTGVNLFASALGEGDLAFVDHMISVLRELLQANDNEEARVLRQSEQNELDKAILTTLRNPKHLQSLEHLIGHLPKETKEKFSRWTDRGAYNGIFNVKEDGIGTLDKMVGVINLQAYRDTLPVLRPLLMDLFFRVTRLFEAPRYRHLPKQLDVDEAHLPLSIEAFQQFALRKIRTWRKFNASITFWTQSPADYLAIPGWDAIRTAASTYIFLADGQMDDVLYKKAFKLTDGMCDAIRNLVPRQDAFIVQPERGIAKRVILRVEAEQQVINTSKPREVTIRDALIAKHGFDEGFARSVAALTQKPGIKEDAA